MCGPQQPAAMNTATVGSKQLLLRLETSRVAAGLGETHNRLPFNVTSELICDEDEVEGYTSVASQFVITYHNGLCIF
ncbi:hypothetical protein KQX54_020270 [Cotesia glomerata]|uniref:Uncharacterized protein n=1 Tax=Cotesia glomerata TaxID=32391 RepID=A0AAV7IFX3_COTGL|nr:hypothetical protein KQX54_020270 [Cotesia glomerata]